MSTLRASNCAVWKKIEEMISEHSNLSNCPEIPTDDNFKENKEKSLREQKNQDVDSDNNNDLKGIASSCQVLK